MQDKQWYKRTETYAMLIGFAVTFLNGPLGLGAEADLLAGMWGAIAVYAGARGYLKAKQPKE